MTSWEGPLSFSYGVDAFLGKLAPNKQPAGQRVFPVKIDRAALRFQGKESLKQWFDRCAKPFDPEGLEYWRLEENLAAFAIVSWKAGNELEFATINIFKTECSLHDFLDLKEEDLKKEEWREFSKPAYLRLDLDYGTLGPIGTHPLPHIHISPDDPPRFTLDASRSENVIVDFLEFVYRHFFPEIWLSWAHRIWDRFYKKAGRDPERNPFNTIVSAFADNELSVLHTITKEINELVAVLAEAKGEHCDLRMNAADRRLMTFPDRNM